MDPKMQEPSQWTTDNPSGTPTPEFVDPTTIQKANQILDACGRKDVRQLRSLAESRGGLINDELRQQAWPILLGLLPRNNKDDNGGKRQGVADVAVDAWKDLPPHKDEGQVRLDVDRSFIYYPNNQSESELQQRKTELFALIAEVLRRYPYLCYFQGYHDICQVFLLVLPLEWRVPVVARLSVLRIRDFMLPNLGPTTAQLRLLPDILDRADPKLKCHLANVEPFYALSGTLTMYAHNIEAYHDIARLFDVFLAREPVFSIYIFAQIVIDRRDEIFEVDEADMLHVILGKVPPNMDLDALIANSAVLFNSHPPEKLPAWKPISSSSTLKTARNVDDCTAQTMEEGQEYFEEQARELQWADLQDRVKATLWAYRRPATTVGTALAVAGLAVYLRRNPAVVNHVVGFFVR